MLVTAVVSDGDMGFSSRFALSFRVFTDGYGQSHWVAEIAPYCNSSSFLF